MAKHKNKKDSPYMFLIIGIILPLALGITIIMDMNTIDKETVKQTVEQIEVPLITIKQTEASKISIGDCVTLISDLKINDDLEEWEEPKKINYNEILKRGKKSWKINHFYWFNGSKRSYIRKLSYSIINFYTKTPCP